MKEKVCGIYAIINKVNGKMYIGQSIDIKARWRQHRNGLKAQRYKQDNSYLQNAWNRHGEDNFYFIILEACTEDYLVEAEDYWITYYNTLDRNYGYNLRKADLKGSLLEDTKKKISKSLTGRKLSQIHKDNVSKARIGKFAGENAYMFGKHHSEETLIKIRQNHPDFTGENNPFYGKHHTEESRKAMSISRTGKILTAEHRENIGKANRGIKHNTYGKKKPNSSSQYFGVAWHKASNRWIAQLYFNGKRYYFGIFKIEEEAAREYDKKVLEFFGDKAILNFPGKIEKPA